MSFITNFITSGWIKKATPFAFNPGKLKGLLLQLSLYLSKKGLTGVKEHLRLMYHYLQDIATGKYKDYNIKTLSLIIAAIIYVVTPVDFLPDIIPSGLVDDASILMWAFSTASDELEKYNQSTSKP